MNGADPVFPENTVSVFGLSQNEFFPGSLAVAFQKYVGIHINKGSNGLNIFGGDIGAAESLAAVAALPAVENILGRQGITGHGVSPWLFSG
jgi:hypothetical protein